MSLYLDYNATAPLRPVALAAFEQAYAHTGNASSVHAAGRQARALVEDARQRIARAAGFSPAELIFTSGGTESNHLALTGLKVAARLTSSIEHESVLKNSAHAQRLPVTADGLVDLTAARALIAAAKRPALVSVMWVNNETGVIQPIAQLLGICREYGAYLHVDAVQALGRVALDVPVDLLTLSAHKVGGPLGVGALLVRAPLDVEPLLCGGGQERGRRAGTENVPAIHAFAAAVEAALADLPELQRRAAWRDAFEQRLLQVPGTVIIGQAAPRVANTSCFALPGFKSELQLMQLDLKGVAVSSGSACSSGKVTRSHVLTAMGLPAEVCNSVLRVSFGWKTAESELISCAEIWTELANSVIRKASGA